MRDIDSHGNSTQSQVECSRRHLYGPVRSRRLGRSLGIDIVPYKVCSYDCVYCQLGRTTRLTSEPCRLLDPGPILDELKAWVDAGGQADYITFSGSGEPTLHSDLGRMIRAAKDMTDIPIALITNGSLLDQDEILDAASAVDVLLPSLDAGTRQVFREVNRPADDIGFDNVIAGLYRAGRELSGKMWLEMMLVDGVNDSLDELGAMRAIINEVRTDKLQINTVERPSRSGDVRRLSREKLAMACRMLGGGAEVVAGQIAGSAGNRVWRQVENEILSLLDRRPCTMDDILAVSGRKPHEILKHIQRLTAEGLVEAVGTVDIYYRRADS